MLSDTIKTGSGAELQLRQMFFDPFRVANDGIDEFSGNTTHKLRTTRTTARYCFRRNAIFHVLTPLYAAQFHPDEAAEKSQ